MTSLTCQLVNLSIRQLVNSSTIKGEKAAKENNRVRPKRPYAPDPLQKELYAGYNISWQSVFGDNLVIIVSGCYSQPAVVSGVKHIVPLNRQSPAFEREHCCQPHVEVAKFVLPRMVKRV